MNWVALLQILGETILNLVIMALPIALLFGKKFIGKLGEKVAEVSVSKIKTEIEENVKQSFRVELETFKADLSKSNKMHEIDYSKFQQKRFDVVVELYEKLAIMLGAASDFTNLFISGDNEIEVMKRRGECFDKAERDFNNYLVLNKLFIEEELFEKLSAQKRQIYLLCKQYDDCFSKIRLPGFTENEKLNLQKQLADISCAMPTKLSAIENDLRKLIYPTK